MLTFKHPRNEDIPFLSEITKNTLSGVECYTFLKTQKDFEKIWCGYNDNGEIKSAVFDSKDEYIAVFGEEFPEIFSFPERHIMIWTKEKKEIPEENELSGKQFADFYNLISDSETLSFDNGERYVNLLKKVNARISKVFGIYKNGILISVASVSAQNEKYALISDVFTKAEERNKGNAKKMIFSCVNFALENGKIPFLVCKKELIPFYEKAGFTYGGKM